MAPRAGTGQAAVPDGAEMENALRSIPKTKAEKLVEGYPSLAHEMGLCPEIAILRRFAALNTQNLLYRQAEIIILEEELRGLEQLNNTQHSAEVPNTRHEEWYSTDWSWLGYGDQDNEQWKKFMNLRRKLEEYNNLVLQQVQLAILPDPSRHDLEHLRGRLRRSIDTNHQSALAGPDRLVWGDPYATIGRLPDLFVLRPRPTEDPFTTWMAEQVLRWLYQELWCRVVRLRGKEAKEISFTDATLLRATSLTATVVASVVPVGSIVVLYRVSDLKVRLGLIATFTFMFALCLVGFTTAKRTDIFAATAAFAAVQVVFISGNGVQ